MNLKKREKVPEKTATMSRKTFPSIPIDFRLSRITYIRAQNIISAHQLDFHKVDWVKRITAKYSLLMGYSSMV